MGRHNKRSRNSDNNPDPAEDNGFAQFGGYMEAKKAKLLKQFHHQTTNVLGNKSDIFRGISILVNGYTKPSAEELKALIGQHGGTYHQYQVLGGGTTHIIASNLPNVKITKLGYVPIVKPNWIVDSIENGRLLDFKKYLLYTNQSRTQPRLNLPKIDEISSNEFETNSNNCKTNLVAFVNKALIENITSNESVTKAKDATDPTFLTDFYNNSRLHLIATLGAEFKQLVNQLRELSDGTFEGLHKLKELNVKNIENKKELESDKVNNQVIMHIDMDCFFVSVGLKTRPELRGKPVAVTHSRGNRVNQKPGLADKTEFRVEKIDNSCSLSEIASCSYEAREYGIKNGMFMGPALHMCPALIAIPYDFQCYKEVSNSLYKTIAKYTLNIEAVSCDEMYVDVTNILDFCNLSVEDWATYIRNEISELTGCPCSTGFGSNRLQARMATKKAKPNGQFHLKPHEVQSYFFEQQVGDLPGVGYAILSKLNSIGVQTCGDIQNVSLQVLQSEVGQRVGLQILEQSKGVDKKPLQYEHERKSVSAEMNYGIRFKNTADVYDFFENLSKEVFSRLQETGMKSKCVTLKLMIRAPDAPIETAKFLGHGICNSISRTSSLNSAMSDHLIILKEIKLLFEKLKINPEDIRGVGIQLSRLEKFAKINKLLTNFLNKANDENQLKLKNDLKKEIKNSENKINLDERHNKIDSFKGGALKCEKTIKGGQKLKNRGRPKKIEKSESKSKGTINNLGNYFKITGHSGETSNLKNSSQNSQIDMTVLNELPEDIRNEIIKEYSIKKNQNNSEKISENSPNKNSTKNELDKDFLDALPDDIRKEVLEDFKLKNNDNKMQLKNKNKFKMAEKINTAKKVSETINKQIKNPEINLENNQSQNDRSFSQEFNFSSVNPEDFKVMLNNWLRTEKCPLDYDIELLSNYFYQLAVTRKIEVLFQFIKFLTRNINNKKDCSWHKAYHTILNHLQKGMIEEYGHTLYVPNLIECCLN